MRFSQLRFFALIGGLLEQTARAETSNMMQHAVSAQQQALQRRHALQQALQRKHNESTLMILGGRPGTVISGWHDMAAALGASDGLRLLAVDAAGGTDSLRDLLLLRGIDLALVPANALAHANATASFGPDLRSG